MPREGTQVHEDRESLTGQGGSAAPWRTFARFGKEKLFNEPD